jgi:glycosyltransferase involved in cell wall biosynthesis
MIELDIIIPVYNEGENIAGVLNLLGKNVATPFRVLICYDHDTDNTLPVVRNNSKNLSFETVLIKNQGFGVHNAITTGFKASNAAAVLVFPADTENAKIIDRMYEKFKQGHDIVAASRFMKGGCMKGCPWLKSFLVRSASFTLYWLASIPIKDASNGFRLFSKRLLDTVEIESSHGFTYSLELLVKCHRLRWKIAEVPATWHERNKGQSRFHLFKWLPYYLRWYFYGLMNTYLKKSPETVKLKVGHKRILV